MTTPDSPKLKRIRTRGNLTEKAYQRLKDAIIKGQFPPGALLQEQSLTQAMCISRTPLREAFNRLRAEGLIEGVPHRGNRVTALSTQDLAALFEAREAIETLFLPQAAGNLGRQDLLRLKDALEQAETALAIARDSEARSLAAEQYLRADRALHDELILASQNRYWVGIYYNLRDRVEICSHQVGQAPDRLALSIEEHRRLLAALLEGRLLEARELMRGHIRTSHASVLHIWLEAAASAPNHPATRSDHARG